MRRHLPAATHLRSSTDKRTETRLVPSTESTGGHTASITPHPRSAGTAIHIVTVAVLLYAGLSYGIALLAAAGIAYPLPVVLLWAAALFVFGCVLVRSSRGSAARAAALPLLALLPFAVSLLIPPYRTDDLIYHLLVPERIARAGAFLFDPHNVNTNLPMLFEMPLVLFELPLIDRWVSPFAVNLAVLAGIVFVYRGMAVEHFAVRGSLALGAALVWAYTPVVFDLTHSCYVELFMTLLVMLAFGHYLWFLRDRTQVSRWWYAMVLLGLAAATKYLGLVYLAAVVACEFFAFRGQRRRYWAGVVLAAVVAAPWYVKNWVMLGNPVFPMVSGLFPSVYLSPERAFQFERLLSNYHDGRGIVDTLLLPFKLLAGYEPAPQAGKLGFGGKLSLFFVLPFVGITWRPVNRRVVAGLFVLYGIFWAISSQQVRFLLPAATLASLGGLQVLSRFGARTPWALVALLAVTMVQNLVNIGGTVRDSGIGSLLAGRISADTFLASHLPVSYGFAQHINERLDPALHRLLTVGNFGRNYYFDIPAVTHTYYDTEYFDRAFAPEGHDTSVVERLVSETAVTHMLFDFGYYRRIHAHSRHVDARAVEDYLMNRFEPIMRSGDVVLFRVRDDVRSVMSPPH
ncbi:MAG: hypothetical protein GF331_20165 [Chitinivibrionales bacterium]|nr:hypothetical protein [Chitinivibrionales bacterium]